MLVNVCVDVWHRLFGFRDEKKTEAVPKLQLHVPEALLEADITEVCCTYHHVCTVHFLSHLYSMYVQWNLH